MLFEDISNSTHLVPFSHYYKIDNFKSGIPEYDDFLKKEALKYQNAGICSTQLLIDNYNGDVIGYFSLCMASIKLTSDEKDIHNMEDVIFSSIPSLKIGKLAIDTNFKSKGYGSYLINLILGIANESALNGISCRFIVVDADIQYDENTIKFYERNDFLVNESFIRRNKSNEQKTISMRLDIYNIEEALVSTGTE